MDSYQKKIQDTYQFFINQNYRKAECCRNCKNFKEDYLVNIPGYKCESFGEKTALPEIFSIFGVCDKFKMND